VEGQQDSLWPLQQLVKMWSNGARDEEIERVVQTLKHELRRRGHRDHLQPDGRGIDRRAERDPCQSRSGQVDDACRRWIRELRMTRFDGQSSEVDGIRSDARVKRDG